MDNIQLGERIRILRERKGLSQQEFSSLIGRSINMITKYEKGRTPISKSMCLIISQTLGVTVDYLMSSQNENVTNDEVYTGIVSEPRTPYGPTQSVDYKEKYYACLEETLKLHKEIDRLKNHGSKPIYS